MAVACRVGDGLHRGHQVGDARDRHADVLDEHGAEPLDARDGHPAGAHEQLALVGVVGHGDVGGAGRLERVRHDRAPRRRRRRPGRAAARRCHGSRPIGRTASTAATAAASISSSAAGRTAGDDRGDGPAGRHHVGEGADDRRGRRRQRAQAQRGLGDDAERALRADEQPLEVVAGHVLDRAAAEAQRPAVGQHHLDAEHVVGGHAVLHAAQPAGVGGQVPADRADLERRRVGRVPEPVLAGGRLHLGVEQARAARRRPSPAGRSRWRASARSTA